MKERFAKLIDLKSIITLVLVAAVIMFVQEGKLEAKIIETLALMAVSYYLGAKTAKHNTPTS